MCRIDECFCFGVEEGRGCFLIIGFQLKEFDVIVNQMILSLELVYTVRSHTSHLVIKIKRMIKLRQWEDTSIVILLHFYIPRRTASCSGPGLPQSRWLCVGESCRSSATEWPSGWWRLPTTSHNSLIDRFNRPKLSNKIRGTEGGLGWHSRCSLWFSYIFLTSWADSRILWK